VRGHPQAWASLALLGVTVAWGATFVVVQNAVAVMPVADFLFWRFAIAALLLALVNPRALRRLSKQDVRRGLGLSLILAAAYLLQTVGLQYTAASVSGFITGMFLVFVPLISAALFRRRVPASAWFAVALATFGLAALGLRGFALGYGELLTLFCAFGFALHLVLLGEWSRSATAYGLTVLQLAGAAVVCGAAGLQDGRVEPPPSTELWWIVAFMAVVATMLAYLIQTWAIPVVGSVRGAVILTGEPVFAGIFGVLLAGDEVTVRTVVGGACIIGAMLLVELAPRHRSPQPADAGSRESPERTT
jgi:drug/metabolite transporter (DMT)-like permease